MAVNHPSVLKPPDEESGEASLHLFDTPENNALYTPLESRFEWLSVCQPETLKGVWPKVSLRSFLDKSMFENPHDKVQSKLRRMGP